MLEMEICDLCISFYLSVVEAEIKIIFCFFFFTEDEPVLLFLWVMFRYTSRRFSQKNHKVLVRGGWI